MILEQIYRNFPEDTTDGGNARALLFQTHWFSSIAELDPRTAEALPQTLYSVLWKITSDSSDTSGVLKDRLWRITEHVRLSLEKLFRELNESPRREHAILPIRAVRELDTTSFMALARRPGRNIREKLAGKPYMLAVRRVQSVDLPENRLLKAFSEQLVEFLELRAKYLGEDPDELIEIIHSWLQTDEAQSISYWDNVPPNNTLLTHRDYRAVYDAWCWLQSLDDDLTIDLKNLDQRQKIMGQWKNYGQMYANGKHIFAEMPVLFDYDKFEIHSWTGQILTTTAARCAIPAEDFEIIRSPVCVDLTDLHPAYAWGNNKTSSGNNFIRKNHALSFLWQSWHNPNVSAVVDVDLFKADVLYLHHDAVTVSAPDLFFSREHGVEYLDRAARAFVTQLRETFVNENIVWLQPDFLNDFELTITRRNINTVYPGAQPLPRSVAAVLEKVDYKQLANGFSVVVLDNIGGVNCATKLEAKFDAELKKCLPETYGFYWERHPPIILSEKEDEEEKTITEYDIATLDEQGKWLSPVHSHGSCNIAQDNLRKCKQIGHYNSLIQLSESPVIGGIKLHELQKRAGDIPLWRDQIPELSIKAMVNGRYQRFYLVSRGTTVKTIRGKAIKIPVREGFTLPAGKDHYQFPLFIGEDEAAVGFSARLESPDFPLDSPLECRLDLTFTYGEDDPYRLVFEPIKQGFRPIRAQWTKTTEEIVTDAPAPAYPQITTWDGLQNFPKMDSDETQDLLEWVTSGLKQLRRRLYYAPRKREVGVLNNEWLEDKNGLHYSFAFCEGKRVFIHENNFVKGQSYLNFSQGDEISFELTEYKGKYSGRNISAEDYVGESGLRKLDDNGIRETVKYIHKSLYFPTIQVWRDGRSVTDTQCPDFFRNTTEDHIVFLNNLLNEDLPAQIKNEILFLLSCMHKDAPEECISWIAGQVENSKVIDKRAVGFGIGDLSEPWQEAIFDSLILHMTNDSLRVFSYAIWRGPHFVNNFTLQQYQAVLQHLLKMLANIKPCPPRKSENNFWTTRNWVRLTTEPLELLLGLLRTRSSSTEDIRMLLQPHQKITKDLAKQVDRIADIFANSPDIVLFSRVQLGDLPVKSEEDHTPDLLYALRLYLTGDDGANAIQITGISDGDND